MKNNRISRFLAILLGTILVLACLAAPVLAEEQIQFVEVRDWTELQNALYAGGNVKLMSNVAAVSGESALEVPGEKSVILDLNGKTIDRFLTSKDSVANGYVIKNYGTLIIEDNSDRVTTQTGMISGGNTSGNGGGIYNQGTLAIRDGSIGLNRATGRGGGIYNAEGATLNIQGGSVIQNFAATDGGGIYNAGTMNIYGGEVLNNIAFSHGGGIMQNGTMNVAGQPVVTGNHASVQTIENNIYLDPASHTICITDALEAGADLGITTVSNTGIITSGYGDKNGDTSPRSFFHSDNLEFGFRLSAGGEVEMAAAEDEANVKYIERSWSGTNVKDITRTLDYVPVFPQSTTVSGGTYIVNQNITIDGRVELQDDTKLILKDGYTLTVKGLTIAAGKTLQIYGQKIGSGKLISKPASGAAIGGSAGSWIEIHGGQITATGAGTGAGVENNAGGDRQGFITIFGGMITAAGGTGGGAGIGGGTGTSPDNIAVHGGTVIATGRNGGAGIGGGMGAEGGAVRITGGTITATGSGTGAGIGGSGNGKAYVSIEGGQITATGSVGIGCGEKCGETGALYDVMLDWLTSTKDKISISASSYRGRIMLNNNAHYFRNETYLFTGQYPDPAQLASSGAVLTAWDGKITSWALLQQAINNDPFNGYLQLDSDITAAAGDTCLLVSSGQEFILDMNGHTIDRNLTDYIDGGGAMYVAAGAKLTIKDADNSGDGGTIKNGYNNGHGGAIRNEGTLTIEGITISDSHAYGSGGGVSNSGTLTMKNCTVTNCDTDKNSGSSAAYGGGVDSTGTLTMTGCVITNNKSRGFGAGICSNGTADITGCVIQGNGPKRTDIREVYGGGIEIYDGTATITDTIIRDNTASMNGGGIFNYKGNLTISGGTVTGNTSDLNGGGIMTFERIKIKGALKVYDNTTKGTNHCKDICLPAPRMLDIDGPLEDAEIHVGIAENLMYPVPGVIAYTYHIDYLKPEAFVPADVYTDCIIVRNENNEIELKQQYWVSFDPGESASGEMEPSLVTIGDEYELPDCGFTCTDSSKTFRCWSVQVGEDDPVERNPGDPVVITAATTVTPTWKAAVTYINENGDPKTITNYRALVGTETTLAAGTYVLDSASLNLGSITLSGNVVLVLEDGCTLNAMGGISGDHNLTICGQSGQTGKLLAAGDVRVKDLTVGGGRIQSFNGTGLYGGEVRINAGSVNTGMIQATAGKEEYGKGFVVINGGQVTASEIHPLYGGIILDWTKTTDFVKVNHFDCAVIIREGKALKNGSAVYSGNVDPSQLDGKKLEPSHLHHFIYTADGAVLTATCDAAGLLPCTLPGSKVTLTITAPQKSAYGDPYSAEAGLEGLADFNAATGRNISLGDIRYNYGYIAHAPTNAGNYVASLTVENVRADLYYSIAPKQILITGATAQGRP